MRILLTNDDGVHAPGLWYAASALNGLGEVIVCVPDREQSGVGTSITLHHPVRVNEVAPILPGMTTYAVDGTPSDAVILALETLVGGEVDLVVSGINQGANLGWDMLISGTLAAALQAYSRGHSAIAISIAALFDVPYEPAALLLRALVPHVMEDSFAKPFLLNVNLPKKSVEEIEGIEVTRMGKVVYLDQVQEGDDIRRPYYWIARTRPNPETPPEGTDVAAVRANRISITPLQTDLSFDGRIPEVRAATSDLLEELKSPGLLSGLLAEGGGKPSWMGGKTRTPRPLRGATPRLICDDLEATIAFYQRLGFQVDHEYKDKEEQRWEVLLRRDSVTLRYARKEKYEAAAATGFEKDPRGVGVDIFVTTLNVERIFKELQETGAPMDPEMVTTYLGAREFAILDPNGYRLVFSQAGPPRRGAPS